jgi:hypothetical protein
MIEGFTPAETRQVAFAVSGATGASPGTTSPMIAWSGPITARPFPLGYAQRTEPYPLWIRKLVPCFAYRVHPSWCKVHGNIPGEVSVYVHPPGSTKGWGPHYQSAPSLYRKRWGGFFRPERLSETLVSLGAELILDGARITSACSTRVATISLTCSSVGGMVGCFLMRWSRTRVTRAVLSSASRRRPQWHRSARMYLHPPLPFPRVPVLFSTLASVAAYTTIHPVSVAREGCFDAVSALRGRCAPGLPGP